MSSAQRTACLVVLAVAAVAASDAKPASGLVNALDAAVQRRLADPSATRFGITRLGPRHQPEFMPETSAEEQMLEDMARAGWNVSVYLGGRGLLVPERQSSAVQGPVIVSQAVAGAPAIPRADLWRFTDAPPAYAMQYEARTAFKAVMTRPDHEFSVGRWRVVARPVRASSQACVDCHNRSAASFGVGSDVVKLGDLLGVAMYAFSPAASATPPSPGPVRRVAAPTIAISGRVTGVDEAVLARVTFAFARLGDGGPAADRLINVRPIFNADGSFTMRAPVGSFQLRVTGMLNSHRVQALTYGAVNLRTDPMVVSEATAAPLLVALSPNER